MFWAKKLSGIWSKPVTPKSPKSFDEMPSVEFFSESVCDCSATTEEASFEERSRSEERDSGREQPDFEQGDSAVRENSHVSEGDYVVGEKGLPNFEEGDVGPGEVLPDFEDGDFASGEEPPSFYERMVRDGDFEKACFGAPELGAFPLSTPNHAVSITESYSGSEALSDSMQEIESTRYAEHHEKATTEEACEDVWTKDGDWLQATATWLTLQARFFEHTPLQNRLLMLALTLHDAKECLAPTLSWNAFYQGCRSLGFCITTGELLGAALSGRLLACPEQRVSLWHLRRPELLIVRRTCLCHV